MAADSGVLVWVTLVYFLVVFGVSVWGYRRAQRKYRVIHAAAAKKNP